jgi:MscS family membrane protein
MAPGEKVAAARALYDLVDLTTFQLWSIPGKRAPGDTFQLRLQQAGSDAVLPLTFRRSADEKWWIVAPTDDELATYGKALLARFGGHPPAPDAYLRQRDARDTISSFLSAFADWDGAGKARALATLDTSELAPATREYEGLLAAQYLKLVLDRISQITPQEIPNDPADRQPYVHFVYPAGRIVIAPEGEGTAAVWKFTPDTVRTAHTLYAAIEDMPAASTGLLEAPPSAFFVLRARIRSFAPSLLIPVGPIEWWQIVGAVLGVLICLLIAIALSRPILMLVRWDVGGKTLAAERAVMWPLRLALTGILFKLAMPLLGWPEEVRQFSAPIHAVVIGVFGVWAGWYLINALSHNMVVRAERTSGTTDEISISLVLGALRLGMLFAAMIYVATALSIPTGGLLAGLGISGLAVAFASKETLSNVFGAGILVADRPFRKGDWIRTGEIEGTVEQVGIRSTRIRTMEDTEVVVPNGKLADASIDNWGNRKHRLLRAALILGYGATPARLESFLAELWELIAGSPGIVAERTQVGIGGLGESGITVDLTTYLDVATLIEEHARKNTLLLDILRLAERLGIAIGNTPVRVLIEDPPERYES